MVNSGAFSKVNVMELNKARILLGCLGFCRLATGQSLHPDDWWAWRTASDPQITADGDRVVFVEERNDRAANRTYSNLWFVSSDGKNLRALTEGAARDTSPRWSPDGSRIAYLSDRGGTVQIYVRQVEGGQEQQITSLDRAPLALAWSPDGNAIAFTAPAPAKREVPAWAPAAILPRLRQPPDSYVQVFVAPASGGAARQLSTGDFDRHGEPVWTPGGQQLLLSWLPDPDDPLRGDEIYSIRVSDGMVRRLTDRAGPDENPTPSPDGSKIAYIGYDYQAQSYRTRKLFVMNADGSRVKVLSGLLDRDAREPRWSSDSRTVYFLADDRGSTHVYAARNDGTVRQATSAPGRLRGFSLADDGRAVTIRSRLSAPAEVVAFAVDVPSEMTKIAAVNEDLLAGRNLGAVEEIAYPSYGSSIQAWVVKPPQFDASRKYPLILDILDAPGRMYGAEFNWRAQILAAGGFVVLCANARGSAGYGEQFGNLLPTRFPGDDYEDLMRGVDLLLSREYVDAGRVMVAGGLAAAWALGHTDRFAAAVVRRPIVDWATDVATRPDGAYRAAQWMKAMPWENPEQYVQRSPLFSAQNLKTPTLVLAGDPDPESEQLYFALRMKKVDSALVSLPEAERPGDVIAELETSVRWLQRFSH